MWTHDFDSNYIHIDQIDHEEGVELIKHIKQVERVNQIQLLEHGEHLELIHHIELMEHSTGRTNCTYRNRGTNKTHTTVEHIEEVELIQCIQ